VTNKQARQQKVILKLGKYNFDTSVNACIILKIVELANQFAYALSRQRAQRKRVDVGRGATEWHSEVFAKGRSLSAET